MPGNLYEIECRACGELHEVTTGVGICIHHGRTWGYRQMVCPSCEVLVSTPVGCCREVADCERCGGALVPWRGVLRHEMLREGGIGSEHLVGPCPRCGSEISDRERRMSGEWD